MTHEELKIIGKALKLTSEVIATYITNDNNPELSVDQLIDTIEVNIAIEKSFNDDLEKLSRENTK